MRLIGIACEDGRVGNIEPPVVDAKICHAPDAAACAPAQRVEDGGEGGQCLELLYFERRAQHGGEIAYVLGDQEVVLHEALDRNQAGARARIAQPFGEHRLHVERQPLLGPAGDEVQMAAHRPEEFLAAAKRGALGGSEDRRFLVPGIAADSQILGQPLQRVQIAQTAFSILDIGLDAIARFARPPVALVALGELGGDELAGGAFRDILGEAAIELLEQGLIAEDEASVEDRRADGDVGVGELDALIDGARGVADLLPHIPKQVEHVLDDALAPRRLLVGKHEQEIDVGPGRQHAAAVATGGNHGHALGIGGVVGAVDVRRGVVVDEPYQLVLEA